VAEMLSHAAVYAFPSVYEEIWGLALTEAMACGCACVAFDVAGARAQITQWDNGWLLESRNAKQLADALYWVLAEKQAAAGWGRNARCHVEHDHNLLALGKRWEKTLEEVMNGGV